MHLARIDEGSGRRVARSRIPRAKTAVPALPAGFVPRLPLRGVVDRATRAAVTLVCAPAGYGKTVLLSDWASATDDGNTAWVSLDGDDNDAQRFWSAVLGAVTECPCIGPGSPLRELRPPTVPDDPSFVAAVVDAFDSLPSPVRLVLDDLHEAVAVETLDGAAALIRHRPRGLRVVLSTRFDPPLPLARLRVEGQLTDIRADRLRFSAADTAALLHAAGVELTEEQHRVLFEQTDGWAAGLRLAALALRESTDRDRFLADFAGDDHAVAGYLISEVFERLPEATNQFLRLMSVPDEVSPPLAVALSGQSDAGVLLDALDHDSGLVTRVDADGQYYRLPALLRTYLRAELRRRQPTRYADLHGRAAAFFAKQGQSARALDHATETGNTDFMAGLLGAHGVTWLLTGDHAEVRRALSRIGQRDIAAAPRLTLISALARVQSGELAAAEAELDRFAARWRAEAGPDIDLLLHLVEGHLVLGGGRPRTPAAPTEHAGQAPIADASLRAWARVDELRATWKSGDRGALRGAADQTLRLARERGLDYLAVQCHTVLGAVALLDGDYPAMSASCAEAVGLADRHGWPRSPGVAADQLMLAYARLLRADPDGALRRTAAAADAVPVDAEPTMRRLVAFVEGAARFDAGDRARGLRLMRQTRRSLQELTRVPELAAVVAMLEQQAALVRRSGAAEPLAWARTRISDTAELALMSARYAAATGEVESAKAELRCALDGAVPSLLPITAVDCLLLTSQLALRSGQRTMARTALVAALELAEPGGSLRPFTQAGADVQRLLFDQLGGFGASEIFAAQVSRVIIGPDRLPAGHLLTDREQAVLAHLRSPRSLTEIADDLAVSVNTIKTHVRAIYAKLGVNSRRAAVVTARELGLS